MDHPGGQQLQGYEQEGLGKMSQRGVGGKERDGRVGEGLAGHCKDVSFHSE